MTVDILDFDLILSLSNMPFIFLYHALLGDGKSMYWKTEKRNLFGNYLQED